MATAIARSMVVAAGGSDAFVTAMDATIDHWFDAAKEAAARCRWASGDETDIAALLGKLGFSELVDCLTGREAAVMLALLPQFPSICHHGPSLAEALNRWIGLPVRYIAHLPRHHRICREDQSLLGGGKYSRLGVDLVLGNSMKEHRTTIAFEVDLRADKSLDRLAAGRWAKVDGRHVTPTKKLVMLIETLVSASLCVEWQWLFTEVEPQPVWRLGDTAQSRLGWATKLPETGPLEESSL